MTTTMPASTSTPPAAEPPQGSLVRRFVRGRPQDPAWVRPALFTLLAVTAVLYLWDLGASGYANSFYSAAVQAGSKSWKAFFFGSSDAANSITVDKPPASLWVMDISARIFGVNAWSILVPQALEGVATVGFLYLTVRRWFSPAAGLLAGAVLALTPVAVLMFRFNNPDALLVLLMTVAAYALTRALEKGKTSWLLVVGGLIGTAFLVKMLQAFLVVPGFALVYLIAAPPSFVRRLWQLFLAGLVMLVSAGWWVAAVQLTPAGDRPYVGGSQHNSELELIFGYNGFGRLTGNETGSVTGGGGGGGGTAAGGSMWGKTGLTRLFGSDMGGQISWLLPAALILLAAGLWLTLRTHRTNRLRAALIIWGGWLLVTAATFSFGQGIIHPYYTVALAPAIGALVGIGGVELWRLRETWFARIALAAAIAVTAWWAHVLLGRSSSFQSWLAPTVLVAGIAAAILVVVLPLVKRFGTRFAPILALVAVLSAVGGPAAYAIETTTVPHTGSIPSAGPTVSGGNGFGGGGQRGGGGGGFGGQAGRQGTGTTGGGTTGGGTTGTTGRGNFPGGGQFGQGGQGGTPPTGTGTPPTGTTGTTGTRGGFGGGTAGGAGGAGGGGAGGLLDASTPSAALVTALKANASSYTWVAAAIGSNTASGYQLATGDSVMPIGGFNGSDPSPTLAQFEKLVKAGKIHYFIGSGGLGTPNGGSTDSSSITSWVEKNYTATTVGGVTLYDLTKATTTTS